MNRWYAILLVASHQCCQISAQVILKGLFRPRIFNSAAHCNAFSLTESLATHDTKTLPMAKNSYFLRFTGGNPSQICNMRMDRCWRLVASIRQTLTHKTRHFIQKSCQKTSYRELVEKSCQETSYGDLVQRSCQETSCRDLANRALIEILYRDLARRPLTEILYKDIA